MRQLTTDSCVVLLSGGVDSAVLLRVVGRSARPIPLFVDYGQRSREPERAAAEAQCAALGLPLVALDLAAVGDVFQAGERSRAHVPLPHRNLVVLSLALSYAAQVRAPALAIAVIRGDLSWYASASAGFLEAFRGVAGSLEAAELQTPLVTLDKVEVIREGARVGVDFTTCYSCMMGGVAHCGRCRQCQDRRTAFAAAGVPEPDGFYRG